MCEKSAPFRLVEKQQKQIFWLLSFLFCCFSKPLQAPGCEQQPGKAVWSTMHSSPRHSRPLVAEKIHCDYNHDGNDKDNYDNDDYDDGKMTTKLLG